MFRSSISRHLRRISSNLDHAESRVTPLGVAACRNMTYATTPLPEFAEFKTYADLYKFSITKQGDFWDRLGKSRIEWFASFLNFFYFDFFQFLNHIAIFILGTSPTIKLWIVTLLKARSTISLEASWTRASSALIGTPARSLITQHSFGNATTAPMSFILSGMSPSFFFCVHSLST